MSEILGKVGVSSSDAQRPKLDLTPARKRVKLLAHEVIYTEVSLETQGLFRDIHVESVKHSEHLLRLVQERAPTVDMGRLIAAMDAIRAASRDVCDAIILPQLK